MSVGISLTELLVWNDEASHFWKAYLDANAQVLQLPCDIGSSTTVQELVRHIWGVELRWAQRLAELPVTGKDEAPQGPVDALFALHLQAVEIFRGLLPAPHEEWSMPYVLEIPSIPPVARTVSRRKVALHALFHSQRHWAQLATLLRQAGFPSGFKGDLLFTLGLN